ncbi:MAG: hypothetical protein HC797_07500 [Anaerolineales bacterium]|nr:hypothetical protein [Anaerolineales bacterium]
MIVLLLRERDRRYALLNVSPVPTVTELVILSTPTSSPLDLTPSPTQQPATSTSTPTPEIVPTQNSAPEVTPTETAVVTEPTSQPEQASNPDDCPANPTRIQTGIFVKVLDWLNFRTGPDLHYEIQHTNRPGTEMEVIGGPVCTVWYDDPPRAYLWWKVRMESGQEGWSAEAPLNFPNYFLEPTE